MRKLSGRRAHLGLSRLARFASAKGIELATRIAGNAFLTNFAVMHALPRIAEQDRASGYVMEGLMAAIAGNGEEAKARVNAFLEKRGPKVARG